MDTVEEMLSKINPNKAIAGEMKIRMLKICTEFAIPVITNI